MVSAMRNRTTMPSSTVIVASLMLSGYTSYFVAIETPPLQALTLAPLASLQETRFSVFSVSIFFFSGPPNPALEGWENSVRLIPSISLQKIAIAYGSSWHGELVARFRLPRRVSSFSCAS